MNFYCSTLIPWTVAIVQHWQQCNPGLCKDKFSITTQDSAISPVEWAFRYDWLNFSHYFFPSFDGYRYSNTFLWKVERCGKIITVHTQDCLFFLIALTTDNFPMQGLLCPEETLLTLLQWSGPNCMLLWTIISLKPSIFSYLGVIKMALLIYLKIENSILFFC